MTIFAQIIEDHEQQGRQQQTWRRTRKPHEAKFQQAETGNGETRPRPEKSQTSAKSS